jgi:hypothetical protein
MTEPIQTTLDKCEEAIFALRTSTRRQQARALLTVLKGNPVLSSLAVAVEPAFGSLSGPSAQQAWDKAIDLILEEKV